MATEPEESYGSRGWVYIATVAIVLLPFLFLLPFTVYSLFEGSFPLIRGSIHLFLLAYYLTSIRIVQENHVGGIFVLQQYAWEIGPGIYFAPRFLTELHVLPMSDQQQEYPGNPEEISKRHEKEDLNGLLRPYLITTAGSEDANEVDPLKKRLTLEPTLSTAWRLRRGGFFEMWVRIPGSTWDEKREFVRQTERDSVPSALVISFAARLPTQIYTEKTAIDEEVTAYLKNRLGQYGIEYVRVEMKPPPPPYAVNAAMANNAAAVSEKQTTIMKAEGTKAAEVLVQTGIAEGRERLAQARVREIAAEGEGLKLAADAAGIATDKWRDGDIAKEVLNGSTVIVGTDSLTGGIFSKLFADGSKGAPK